MSEDGATNPGVDTGIGSAGSLLRAARERQGMHIAALAAALKVAPRKLELVETDRYDELHDATFVRALALSMCRALRIDPQPVLERLPQTGGYRLEDVNRGLNQPFRDRAVPVDSFEWRRYLSAPVIAAALLVIAAVALYVLPGGGWWPLGGDTASTPAAGTSTVESGGTPAASPVEAAGSGSVIAGLAASAVEAATSVMTPSASTPAAKAPAASASAPAVATAPAPAPAPQAAAPAPSPVAAQPSAPVAAAATVSSVAPAASAAAAIAGVLKMHAQAESWVEVRDRDGRVLVQRTLAAGESVAADGALPFRVTVGNATGTQVEFRGQPVALVPARDNVARLELK